MARAARQRRENETALHSVWAISDSFSVLFTIKIESVEFIQG